MGDRRGVLRAADFRSDGYRHGVRAGFADQVQAHRAASALRLANINDDDFEIKSSVEYKRTLKGWFDQLFAMPEPLSGSETEGLPHEDARWYEDQIKNGEPLAVVRTERPDEIPSILQQSGAGDGSPVFCLDPGRPGEVARAQRPSPAGTL